MLEFEHMRLVIKRSNIPTSYARWLPPLQQNGKKRRRKAKEKKNGKKTRETKLKPESATPHLPLFQILRFSINYNKFFFFGGSFHSSPTQLIWGLF